MESQTARQDQSPGKEDIYLSNIEAENIIIKIESYLDIKIDKDKESYKIFNSVLNLQDKTTQLENRNFEKEHLAVASFYIACRESEPVQPVWRTLLIDKFEQYLNRHGRYFQHRRKKTDHTRCIEEAIDFLQEEGFETEKLDFYEYAFPMFEILGIKSNSIRSEVIRKLKKLEDTGFTGYPVAIAAAAIYHVSNKQSSGEYRLPIISDKVCIKPDTVKDYLSQLQMTEIFEYVDPRDNVSKNDVLMELQRVSEEAGTEKLRQKDYREHGNFDLDKVVMRKYYDWNEALRDAGLVPVNPNREDILQDLKMAKGQANGELNQRIYRKHGHYSIYKVQQEFGSWSKAKKQVDGGS